jgi:hypothetical protein
MSASYFLAMLFQAVATGSMASMFSMTSRIYLCIKTPPIFQASGAQAPRDDHASFPFVSSVLEL